MRATITHGAFGKTVGVGERGYDPHIVLHIAI